MNGVHINLSGAVHGNPSDVTATFLVVLAKLDIGRVLYGGGNKVTFAGPAKQGGVQGGVISLGAAGVKNNLAGIGIDQTGDLFAGGGQGGAELLARRAWWRYCRNNKPSARSWRGNGELNRVLLRKSKLFRWGPLVRVSFFRYILREL